MILSYKCYNKWSQSHISSGNSSTLGGTTIIVDFNPLFWRVYNFLIPNNFYAGGGFRLDVFFTFLWFFSFCPPSQRLGAFVEEGTRLLSSVTLLFKKTDTLSWLIRFLGIIDLHEVFGLGFLFIISLGWAATFSRKSENFFFFFSFESISSKQLRDLKKSPW